MQVGVQSTTALLGRTLMQLAELIHKIKTNPNDRRLVLSAWNPAALKDMALPPCHMFCQVIERLAGLAGERGGNGPVFQGASVAIGGVWWFAITVFAPARLPCVPCSRCASLLTDPL
jgi:hypothetical protein